MDASRTELNREGDTYTPDHQKALAENLLAITRAIHDGSLSTRDPTLQFLCDLHSGLFHGVRSHAGRIRARGVGSEYLSFGPNRSLQNISVPDALLDLFMRLQNSLDELTRDIESVDFEERAVRLAVVAHADLVEIHPFEDGNGRCARMLMNWILVRLGLHPVAFEVVKAEYLDCLNHYYRTKDSRPLEDLALAQYRVD